MSETCVAYGAVLTPDGAQYFERLESERNEWIQRFNRLEAAVSRHIGAKAWTDDADDALHAAYARILKDAADANG